MLALLKSRWFRFGAPQFAVGAALGVALALLLPFGSEDSDVFSLGDRVVLTIPGQTGGGGGFLTGSGVSVEIRSEELPLTAAQAVASGWTDPVLCTVGRGRYFQKTAGGEAVPYMLMYDSANELVGIYQISRGEMPAPWARVDVLEGGGLTIVDFEHWGLFVYFRDPTRACSTAEGGGATYGYREGRFGSEVRSTPTPVLEPTPTPSPSGVLNAAADKMAALKSISLTVTHEGDAQVLEAVVELPDKVSLKLADPNGTDISLPLSLVNLGATLGDIARAVQDPVEADSVWIENVRHRGISGTVLGQRLSALVPTASADARVAVKIWVDADGMIKRVRIEGPVAADDEPDVVRVLDIGDTS